MINKSIRRKVDLEAVLVEMGADLESLKPLSKMERVRSLRNYVHDLRMAVDAEKLLFGDEPTR